MWTATTTPERPLDWEWARSRLSEAECYWVVSVPEAGPPAPRPVWGVWVDNRLLLSVGTPSHWRNIASRSDVAVHLGDPLEVVVVEGSARRVAEPTLHEQFVAAYNQKYDWNFEPTMDMVVNGCMEVTPSAVLAWVAADAAHSSSDMDFPLAAGKWRFD